MPRIVLVLTAVLLALAGYCLASGQPPKPSSHPSSQPRVVTTTSPVDTIEAVANRLACYAELGLRLKDMTTRRSLVREQLLERIATYEEPVDQQIARAWIVAYNGFREDTDLGKSEVELAKTKWRLDTAVLEMLAKDQKWAGSIVDIAAMTVSDANREGEADQLEKVYLGAIVESNSPSPVDSIVRVTGVVEGLSTKEVLDARKQIRVSLRAALAERPDALKKLSSSWQSPPDLRELRQRARELVEKASKK
jgi:hypothetical protein